MMPAVLKVQPVPTTRRMRQQHIHFARVPRFFISRVRVHAHTRPRSYTGQRTDQPITIMLKLIEHKHRFIDLFQRFKECFYLTIMQFMHRARFVIHRAIAQLQQLPGQHSRRTRRYPIVIRHLQQLFAFQRVIYLLRRLIKLHGDFIGNAIGQRQIVFRFHAYADIRYLTEYHTIRAGLQLV